MPYQIHLHLEDIIQPWCLANTRIISFQSIFYLYQTLFTNCNRADNIYQCMAEITEQIRAEVIEIVTDFFAEECEVEASEINNETHIFDDLDGDSLMFLELIEIFKKKYELNIELKTIGKYSVKHPVRTIGELIDMQLLIIEHENEIINID